MDHGSSASCCRADARIEARVSWTMTGVASETDSMVARLEMKEGNVHIMLWYNMEVAE